MIRRPPRSTQSRSSAASDVYKRQALEDGLAHAGYREQVQRLLHGTPVVLRYEDRVAAPAGDLDRLVRGCHIVEQLVELFARVCGADSGQLSPPYTYGKAYAID